MIDYAIEQDRLLVHFKRFDLDEYAMFLRCKKLPESNTIFHDLDETYSIEAPSRFASMLGFEVPTDPRAGLEFHPDLMDDQLAILKMFLAAKRFACWSGCGSGKTLIGLEGARHVLYLTGGRGLIITRNELVRQWIDEAKKFYGETLRVHRIRTRQEMKEWCAQGPGNLAVVNVEKWNPEDIEHQVVNEARHLALVIWDESSRARTGGGKQKWAIINSCRGIEYKLSLTATPAPNELMEFASQASFLEKMRSEGEMIWTYFVRDQKTHRWTVKKHAREAFFRFMSSWSIYVNNPKRFGWRSGQPDVPEPVVHIHQIKPTEEQLVRLTQLTAAPDGQLQLPGMCDTDLNAIRAAKLSQCAKGFQYRKGGNGAYDRIPSLKPAKVAELIRQEAKAGHQVLVWTVFHAESDLIVEALGKLRGVAVLNGKTKEVDRLKTLEAFRNGKVRVLISLADMLGFGMNFQNCTSMIFSGWTFSFESYYQAVRRAYRFGQTQPLLVHIPVVPELEQEMLDTIFHKEGQHLAAIAEMEANYIAAMREAA